MASPARPTVLTPAQLRVAALVVVTAAAAVGGTAATVMDRPYWQGAAVVVVLSVAALLWRTTPRTFNTALVYVLLVLPTSPVIALYSLQAGTNFLPDAVLRMMIVMAAVAVLALRHPGVRRPGLVLALSWGLVVFGYPLATLIPAAGIYLAYLLASIPLIVLTVLHRRREARTCTPAT